MTENKNVYKIIKQMREEGYALPTRYFVFKFLLGEDDG
jgi:hypothetical protein